MSMAVQDHSEVYTSNQNQIDELEKVQESYNKCLSKGSYIPA